MIFVAFTNMNTQETYMELLDRHVRERQELYERQNRERDDIEWDSTMAGQLRLYHDTEIGILLQRQYQELQAVIDRYALPRVVSVIPPVDDGFETMLVDGVVTTVLANVNDVPLAQEHPDSVNLLGEAINEVILMDEINNNRTEGMGTDVSTTIDTRYSIEGDSFQHAVCHLCGGEVFTYFSDAFWCQPCAEADHTPATERMHLPNLFGGWKYVSRCNYFFQTGLESEVSFTQFMENLYITIQTRLAAYQETLDQMNSRGDIIWVNPLRGVVTFGPFVTAVIDYHTLGNERHLDNDEMDRLSDIIQRLMADSVRIETANRNRQCGCDSLDALVLHYCNLCSDHIRRLQIIDATEAQYAFAQLREAHFDFQFQLAHTQYTLDDTQFEVDVNGERRVVTLDEFNMLTGRDDAGQLIEPGQIHNWVQSLVVVMCMACREEGLFYVCPGGCGMCLTCIIDWFNTSPGKCPGCRRDMNPI